MVFGTSREFFASKRSAEYDNVFNSFLELVLFRIIKCIVSTENRFLTLITFVIIIAAYNPNFGVSKKSICRIFNYLIKSNKYIMCNVSSCKVL